MKQQVKMIPVESSNIDSIGYDADSKELYVKFLTGVRYKYSNVPERKFINFITAESYGKYFAEYIRGKFDTEKYSEKPCS